MVRAVPCRVRAARLAAMRIMAQSARSSPQWLNTLALCCAPIVIVAFAWLAYRHSFEGPFIFDDGPSITDNLHIRQLLPLREALGAPPQTAVSGRPVASLTLAINYALGEYDVRGYHVFNLMVHIVAALALYGLVRRTLQSRFTVAF